MSNKNLFNDIAEYYEAYRPGLPTEVVDYLGDRFKLNTMSHVLDLGCGTGQVAKSICAYVSEVICVDLDEEMLRVANIALNSVGACAGKIKLICKKAEELSLPENKIDLITISRAFHWMSHDIVLKNCKSILHPGAGVALLGDSSLWNGNEPWQKAAKRTIQHFLGEKRRAGNEHYAVTNEPYESMLKRHGYIDIEVKDFEITRYWKIDSIFGYLYSTSFSSQRMFGDKLHEFEKMLNIELGNPDQNRVFEERTIFTVKSGRRIK